MKGGKADRKRAKEHVEGLESEADYVEFHEKILSNYIDEEFDSESIRFVSRMNKWYGLSVIIHWQTK